MKWELALACRDEEDLEPTAELPEGHKRKKEGDLIAYKPHPWQWGDMEDSSHLIVIVEGPDDEKEMALLCDTLWDTLNQDDIDNVRISKKAKGKRRFKLPLNLLKDGWYTELDKDRVRDIKDRYQPFKENNIVVDMDKKVSIIFDKGRGSYKYKAKKIMD